MNRKQRIIKEHEEWLNKMGVKRPKKLNRINTIPDYSVKKNAKLSDKVDNGFIKTGNVYTGNKGHTVSLLYNKGSYGVVGEEELKDPALGKRRL
jgi:hypothetical protein